MRYSSSQLLQRWSYIRGSSKSWLVQVYESLQVSASGVLNVRQSSSRCTYHNFSVQCKPNFTIAADETYAKSQKDQIYTWPCLVHSTYCFTSIRRYTNFWRTFRPLLDSAILSFIYAVSTICLIYNGNENTSEEVPLNTPQGSEEHAFLEIAAIQEAAQTD